jgi:beta-galactosidase
MGSREPVLHILGHWNHEPGVEREIIVFTNCDRVELMLNGRSLGVGGTVKDEFPFIPNPPRVWRDVPFEPGVLRASGRRGDDALVHEIVTAGAAAQTRLSASPERIAADGRDTCYIDITVCDADGNRCYTWSGDVTLDVTGAAHLAGPCTVSARGGLARVAIRSNGEVGPIAITAAANGLRAGTTHAHAE